MLMCSFVLYSFIIQIAYGRFSPTTKGYRDLDLFIQQKDGKKMVDLEKQSALCSRLKVEMLHPLRVIIANRGPDTELLVANPVELSGKGRPRVFYDVTLALKTLGICIFSVRKTKQNHINVFRKLPINTSFFPLHIIEVQCLPDSNFKFISILELLKVGVKSVK